jgi:hypothetical protein
MFAGESGEGFLHDLNLWVSNLTILALIPRFGNPDSATLRGAGRLSYAASRMKDFLLTLLHLAVLTAKLCGSGGVRAVIAGSLLLKQQLSVLRRGRRRVPSVTRCDRLFCGFGAPFLSPGRLRRRRPLWLRVHRAPDLLYRVELAKNAEAELEDLPQGR